MPSDTVQIQVPQDLYAVVERAFTFYKTQKVKELEGLKINNENQLQAAIARKNAGGGDTTARFAQQISSLDALLAEVNALTPQQWIFQELAPRIGQLLEVEHNSSEPIKEIQKSLDEEQKKWADEQKILDDTFREAVKGVQ